MKKLTLLLLLFFPCSLSLAIEPCADPALATVRIKSHGASGTIIATGLGKSWILSCAHMFTDALENPSEESRKRPLKIDGPAQPYAPKKHAPARLVGYDYQLDLSLIEIDNGPFNFIPLAGKGHAPGSLLWSCGYDDLKWPVTKHRATFLQTVDDTTYTREKPWHGRSGGCLVDCSKTGTVLIGVVQGYEVYPGDRGLYISLDAIHRFMLKYRWEAPRDWKDYQPYRKELYQQQFQLQIGYPCPT